MSIDEIRIGQIPRRDCSDYDPSILPPRWGDVVTRTLIEWGSQVVFIICFCGQIGSPQQDTIKYGDCDCTCSQGPVTWRGVQDLPYQDALRETGGDKARAFGLARDRSLNPDWTGYYAKKLVGYRYDFKHITGILCRRVR